MMKEVVTLSAEAWPRRRDMKRPIAAIVVPRWGVKLTARG